MAPVYVLITGANRGIGKAFVETYLSRPDHVVIAAVRTPEHATSKSLAEIAKAEGSSLIVVKIDSTVEKNAAASVEQLTKQGIQHLDIVIANAGIVERFPSVAEVTGEEMLAHYKSNVLGPVWLYQATRHLLNKATEPKWVTIGSSSGCIENQEPTPNAAYGPTKAAVHWITKRINEEEPKIAAFVLHPGWVQTDMGSYAAGLFGIEAAPVSIKKSLDGMMPIIDQATMEKTSGKLWSYTGERLAW